VIAKLVKGGLVALALGLGCAGMAVAQDARIDELSKALRLSDTVAIMRDEGLVYGRDLGLEMLPEGDSDGWRDVVSRIHDADKMQALVEAGFAAALEGQDVAPMLAFFASDRGQEIVGLELAARRAFMDDAVEEAAMDRVERLRDRGAPVLERIGVLIEDSDLVERNVTGALNTQLAFYQGLIDGGAFEMSQDDVLADIWGQEETLRRESRDWLNAFLLMAYEPLAPEDLEAYAAFYRSPEGVALNAAVFAAFDRMYEELSYLLGRSIAQRMQGEKL
jgi:ketosteroid isomerase-like protein